MTPENTERWVASNATDRRLWHRGIRRQNPGAVFPHHVAECSGQQLGGREGQTVRSTLPEGALVCSRCAKRAAKK